MHAFQYICKSHTAVNDWLSLLQIGIGLVKYRRSYAFTI